MGKSAAMPYKATLIVFGYGAFLMTVRDFVADLDFEFLHASNIVYALAYYIGAVLIGVGAYQVSRSHGA
jgi:hypothetical protein